MASGEGLMYVRLLPCLFLATRFLDMGMILWMFLIVEGKPGSDIVVERCI